jgi:hypothetical protein
MTRHTRSLSSAAAAALVLAAALAGCADRTPTSPPIRIQPKEKPAANVQVTTSGSTSITNFTWHPGEQSCTTDCNPQFLITEEVVNENSVVTSTQQTGQFGASSNVLLSSVGTVFTAPHRGTAEKLRWTLHKYTGFTWTNCGTVFPDMPVSGDTYIVTFPANATCPSGGSALATVRATWTRGDYAIASMTVPATTLTQYQTKSVTVSTYASNGTRMTGLTVGMTSSSPATVQVVGCSASDCTIKALLGGTVTLTATDATTGVTATNTATATARPVARVDVTPNPLTFHPGDSVAVTARAYDAANAEIVGIPTVTWSTGNATVATVVAANGATAYVKAGSLGTTTVSATMAEGTGSTTVTVAPRVSLSLNRSYAYNQNTTATATPTPAGTYYYQWQYRFCSNSTLASDCNGAYYAAPSGVNVTTLTKYVYARDYWVEFIVTLRESATGTIYDTQSMRVDGAGESSSGGCGGSMC